jgi:hypothetical protein
MGGGIMTKTDPETERGYREQFAELERDDTTSPRARYIQEQHQATLPDTAFNRGRQAATADYIRAQEPEREMEAGQ